MLDTIDMLEAIGSDASLRHASAEELTAVLEQAQASGGLTSAVATGDSAALFMELGHQPNYAPQVAQFPGQEEQEEEPEQDETNEPNDPTKSARAAKSMPSQAN